MQNDMLMEIANRQRGHNTRDMLFVLALLAMLAFAFAGWRAVTGVGAGGVTPAGDMACAPSAQPVPATLRRC